MLVAKRSPEGNKRRYLRREVIRPATLQLGGASYWCGSTIDLSNGGASVALTEDFIPLAHGNPGKLWLSEKNSMGQFVSAKNGRNIPCTIVRVSNKTVAISFDNPVYAQSQLNAVLLSQM